MINKMHHKGENKSSYILIFLVILIFSMSLYSHVLHLPYSFMFVSLIFFIYILIFSLFFFIVLLQAL